jgi:hypothetical protein
MFQNNRSEYFAVIHLAACQRLKIAQSVILERAADMGRSTPTGASAVVAKPRLPIAPRYLPCVSRRNWDKSHDAYN